MKVMIVDDERLARNELRRILTSFPEIEVVGEARNSDEALKLIPRLDPYLIFLDVQMPGGDGFQMLERLDTVPLVIFTTAYDQYALKAFEVSALDYLVKPIAQERLAKAIVKLRARAPAGQGFATPMEAHRQVFVRDGERCWFVALQDIALLESEGNYTRLHFGSNKPLLLRSLNYLQARLDPALFFRANRKQIINTKFIESIHPWPNGGYLIKLRGGLEIAMSRRQAQAFQEARKF
jgi:two-component system LytT family response regulator